MRMFKFFLALLLISPISTWGDSLLNSLKSTVKEETVPSPLNLSSNWWDYYDVPKDTLEKRKLQAADVLSAITKSLPANEKVKAEALTTKFLTGLQTIIDMKAAPAPIASYVATFPEKYTFQEWLELGQMKLQNVLDLEEKELKYNLMQLSILSNSRQLDTFFAAYLTEKKEEQFVHLIKSLEIMNMKVNLAVEQLKLTRLSGEITIQKDKIKQIEKEVHYSQSHIDFKTGNIGEIDARIAHAEEELRTNEKYLPQELQTDIEQTSLKNEIEEQRLIKHSVEHLQKQMSLINLKLQKLVLQLGLKKIKIEDAKNTTQDQINLIAKEASDWKSKTELMLEQVLKNPTFLTNTAENSQENNLFEQFLKNTESILLNIQQIENRIFLSKFLLDEVHVLKKEQIRGIGGLMTSTSSQIGNFFTAHGKWFKESFFTIGNIPVTPLGLLKVALIILIASFIGQFLKSNIHKFGAKHQLMRNSSLYILSRLVYYLVLVIGFIIAGASLGFDLTAFAYIAGAITVWIGFGLQSIFMNFICGIIILLTKTLNVGDIIVLESGEVGQIVEINLRTTILATADGIEIIVPNSELVTKKFTNRTLAKNSRRINVVFRLPITVDKQLIKKVLVEAVLKEPNTLPQPQPELWVIGYGENYLKCEMAIWVNEFLSPLPNMSTNAYYFNVIDDALRASNIEIPIISLPQSN